MNIRNKLRSGLINILASEKTQAARRALVEKKRQLSGGKHTVAVFLELDDPYSYLLAEYLPDLAAAYNIELQYYLAQSRNDEAHRPHPNMLAVYAERDCARLASELGIPFLDKGRAPPVEHRRALIDALAASRDAPNFNTALLEAISLYWRGDSEGVARRVSGAKLTGEGARLLADSAKQLSQLGHYDCATLHYAGEWYRGVDRLHYLATRLDELGLRKESASVARLSAIRQVMQVALPVAPPGAAGDLPTLELFFSFRSPYSYLCLQRTFDIADAFGVKLVVRPVLPLVMRGLQVPKARISYIISDTSREARRKAISIGKFADPIGAGVERCLAVFYYAESQKRARDFLLNASEAIWARGIDVATDKGMRKVTGRCGLFWPDVLAAMQDDGWRSIVAANRDSMQDAGCWGVPTVRLGDFVAWGQDRDWLLVRHIEELCDSGEGILI